MCCILTFDRAGCSSCVNNVIARYTCVNKWEQVLWVTTGIHGCCEIIYAQLTADTGSLAGVSLQSGVLGLDMVSHRDWPPGTQWDNSPQWLLAGKQKRQRCNALKITQRGFVKRGSYGLIWHSVFVSLRLPVSLTHTPAATPFEKYIVRVIFLLWFLHSFITHSLCR